MPEDGEVLISFRVGNNNKTVILDNITLDEQNCAAQNARASTEDYSSLWLGLSLYPNPASKELSIDAGKRENDITNVRIYNTLGVEVKSIPVRKTKANAQLSVDVSQLASGMYILKVYGSDWESSKLFTIKK